MKSIQYRNVLGAYFFVLEVVKCCVITSNVCMKILTVNAWKWAASVCRTSARSGASASAAVNRTDQMIAGRINARAERKKRLYIFKQIGGIEL